MPVKIFNEVARQVAYEPPTPLPANSKATEGEDSYVSITSNHVIIGLGLGGIFWVAKAILNKYLSKNDHLLPAIVTDPSGRNIEVPINLSFAERKALFTSTSDAESRLHRMNAIELKKEIVVLMYVQNKRMPELIYALALDGQYEKALGVIHRAWGNSRGDRLSDACYIHGSRIMRAAVETLKPHVKRWINNNLEQGEWPLVNLAMDAIAGDLFARRVLYEGRSPPLRIDPDTGAMHKLMEDAQSGWMFMREALMAKYQKPSPEMYRSLAYMLEYTLWSKTIEKRPINPETRRLLVDFYLAAGDINGVVYAQCRVIDAVLDAGGNASKDIDFLLKEIRADGHTRWTAIEWFNGTIKHFTKRGKASVASIFERELKSYRNGSASSHAADGSGPSRPSRVGGQPSRPDMSATGEARLDKARDARPEEGKEVEGKEGRKGPKGRGL